MNPVLKKAFAALAVKEIVDRVQDIRRPKRSWLRRNWAKLIIGTGLASGAYYAYKSGKLPGLGAATGSSNGYRDEYPTGPGTASAAPVREGREFETTGS